jgi:hypothetical protein
MTKRDSQLREYASEASDLVTRLRDRAYSFKAPDPLIEEAATEIEVQRACTSAARAEIERLRQFDRLQPIEPADATPATHATPGEGSVQGEGTLTDEEREAIKTAVGAMCIWMADNNVMEDESMRRAVLAIRSLLERLQ